MMPRDERDRQAKPWLGTRGWEMTMRASLESQARGGWTWTVTPLLSVSKPWGQMRFLEHSDVHAEQASGRKQTQTRLVLGITA